MSVLILASGALGPFKTVETLDDRLRCDGVDYCFSVIGTGYTISEDDSLAPVPPEAVPSLAAFEAAVDTYLDTAAQSRGYGDPAWPRGLSIVSARSYAAAPGPYQADGLAAVAGSSAVWAKCYAVLAEVEAGERPIPTIDALIAELPPIAWPA